MAGTILESSKAANLHMPVKEKGGPSAAKQAQAADDWVEGLRLAMDMLDMHIPDLGSQPLL